MEQSSAGRSAGDWQFKGWGCQRLGQGLGGGFCFRMPYLDIGHKGPQRPKIKYFPSQMPLIGGAAVAIVLGGIWQLYVAR